MVDRKAYTWKVDAWDQEGQLYKHEVVSYWSPDDPATEVEVERAAIYELRAKKIPATMASAELITEAGLDSAAAGVVDSA